MNPETAEGQTLKRFAFMLRLREGAAEAYERAHREVWPEMQDMLKTEGSPSTRSSAWIICYFSPLRRWTSRIPGVSSIDIL